MSEKLFHCQFFIIQSSLFQYHVTREAVVVLAARRAKLHVDGERGLVGAWAEGIVQLADDTVVDWIVGEGGLYDFTATKYVCAVVVLP